MLSTINSISKAVLVLGVSALIFVTTCQAGTVDTSRGKYLVEIAGCNDCHTAGYGATGGAIPEDQWLLGDALGYRGGWGTTYAINLREYLAALSEDDWVAVARVLKARPPMPWWALNAMTEDDLRELYRYVKSLDLVKNPVPAYVPPGVEPETPYILWPSPPQ